MRTDEQPGKCFQLAESLELKKEGDVKLYYLIGCFIAPSFVSFIVNSNIRSPKMPNERTVAFPRQRQPHKRATLRYTNIAYLVKHFSCQFYNYYSAGGWQFAAALFHMLQLVFPSSNQLFC